MKKILIFIIISLILIILVIAPLFMGVYISPWINFEYKNIELNNIPVYSQIWLRNYTNLNDKYKSFYFNDSLILVDILNSYNNQYKLFIEAFSRKDESAEYFINEYKIISKNNVYDSKIYDEPIIIPEDFKINNSPFDASLTIGNYYFKNKSIKILINITIKRFDNIETKELEYNFKRKTSFGLYKSVF